MKMNDKHFHRTFQLKSLKGETHLQLSLAILEAFKPPENLEQNIVFIGMLKFFFSS